MNETQALAKTRRSRGQALIIALVVTAVLVTLITVTAQSQRVALAAVTNRMEARRARIAASDAVQLAIQALLEGKSGVSGVTVGTANSQNSSTTNNVTNTITSNLDDWALLGAGGSASQPGLVKYVVNDCSFRVQVVDTCSLIDINTANSTQLMNLPLTQQQVDCLLDFRSTGDTPRPDGAKDSYYNALTNPYDAKEARFDTLDELLQVEYFTPDVLYDPQNISNTGNGFQSMANGQQPTLYDLCTAYAYAPVVSATGTPLTNLQTPGMSIQTLTRLGISQTAATQILANGTGNGQARRLNWTSIGQLLGRITSKPDQTAILNNLTIGTSTVKEGQININTASQNVLQTVPGITPDVAAAIVSQQSSGFASLGAIVNVSGVTGAVLQQAADSLTAVSQTFELRIVSTAGLDTEAYTAIIQIQNSIPKIVYFGRAPLPPTQMMSHWGWNADTTSETDLVTFS